MAPKKNVPKTAAKSKPVNVDDGVTKKQQSSFLTAKYMAAKNTADGMLAHELLQAWALNIEHMCD